MQAARKVYSTVLGSMPGMPQAYVKHAPLMVLACARAELQQGTAGSQQRALHALVWLGCGGPYEHFKSSETCSSERCSSPTVSVLQAQVHSSPRKIVACKYIPLTRLQAAASKTGLPVHAL